MEEEWSDSTKLLYIRTSTLPAKTFSKPSLLPLTTSADPACYAAAAAVPPRPGRGSSPVPLPAAARTPRPPAARQTRPPPPFRRRKRRRYLPRFLPCPLFRRRRRPGRRAGWAWDCSKRRTRLYIVGISQELEHEKVSIIDRPSKSNGVHRRTPFPLTAPPP